jgi:hypothetical protein
VVPTQVLPYTPMGTTLDWIVLGKEVKTRPAMAALLCRAEFSGAVTMGAKDSTIAVR